MNIPLYIIDWLQNKILVSINPIVSICDLLGPLIIRPNKENESNLCNVDEFVILINRRLLIRYGIGDTKEYQFYVVVLSDICLGFSIRLLLLFIRKFMKLALKVFLKKIGTALRCHYKSFE